MIPLDSITRVGNGLNRPECVLATANGRLYTASWKGGVNIIEADGSQWDLLPRDRNLDLKPNGICLMPDGAVLIAHLGSTDGGVYRIDDAGEVTPFCLEVDGEPLPPTNYVHLDDKGRVWITVSTRQIPRALGYRPDVRDGFVVLVDKGIARIVADGLGYTNECLVHPDGKRLLVNETFARKLVSFDIDEQGNLSDKTTLAEFSAGTYPDGMTFDTDGGIWITSIVSNRVIRIAIDGTQTIVIEDNDPEKILWIEEAFQKGEMGRPHLDNVFSRKLKNVSSLAFGGQDLKTGYLGCLLDNCIYSFVSDHSGHTPTHWNFVGPEHKGNADIDASIKEGVKLEG
ncbi:SMP-30/gluconolactonase/LRE family protein [Kiloniella laminariae]|uniref:SMP-30/gluconolactonase/LRE family protein n=1 Tax=Kiloniella laminariae TaxID=454162 RepID=A0ABT4LK44_9PROT|nr:SMP-30/gluconolactonase/LRE family protein [Kiloniella laminariae]MCZ4281478.1 SMP-30/gluconolactonase/LRE family protein [Kiloniella laminariae]